MTQDIHRSVRPIALRHAGDSWVLTIEKLQRIEGGIFRPRQSEIHGAEAIAAFLQAEVDPAVAVGAIRILQERDQGAFLFDGSRWSASAIPLPVAPTTESDQQVDETLRQLQTFCSQLMREMRVATQQLSSLAERLRRLEENQEQAKYSASAQEAHVAQLEQRLANLEGEGGGSAPSVAGGRRARRAAAGLEAGGAPQPEGDEPKAAAQEGPKDSPDLLNESDLAAMAGEPTDTTP